jgi:hypothetical protein
MSLKDTFPYVTNPSDAESDAHIRLKGMAVYWLLTRGFELEDITTERTLPCNGGRTDIYAAREGFEVYIECEVGQIQYSRGGSIPAKDGEDVFIFAEDGIYRLHPDSTLAEPSPLSPTQEKVEFEHLSMSRVSDLPLIDLSAYKDG